MPADLLRGLIPLNTAPVMNAMGNIQQQKQLQLENERQNKLDQLAMAEFEEAKRRTVVDERIRQQNADTNQKIMESNLLNSAQSRDATALEMRQMETELEELNLKRDQRKVKLAIGEFGPALETAMESIVAGYDSAPDEIQQQLLGGLDVAINMFESSELKSAFSGLKEDMVVALQDNTTNGYDKVVGKLERLSSFASAGDEISLKDALELKKLAAETERAETLADRDSFRLGVEQKEFVTGRQQAEIDANSTVDTIKRLLSNDDALKAATGSFFGSKVNIPGGKASLWAEEFDTLMKELTLDKMQVFVGAMSEGERQFASEATGMKRNVPAERVRQVLTKYLNMFEQRGYSGRSAGGSGESNIISEDDF